MTSSNKGSNVDTMKRPHKLVVATSSHTIKQPRDHRDQKRQCSSPKTKDDNANTANKPSTTDGPSPGLNNNPNSPPITRPPQIIIYDFNNEPNPPTQRSTALSPNNDVPPNGDLEEDEVYDSDEEPQEPIEKTFTVIPQAIETLQDLMDIGMLFEDPDFNKKKYSVNIVGLYKMIPALKEFQQMVGMEELKKQVVDQVIYLSGKSNHQQFSTKSACTREQPPREMSTERSLLETLISGMAKPKTSCKQYRMTESVTDEDNNFDMFHTVIYGPPGVGKTAFAKVLARIFLSLGVTQTDTFRIARRSDLIGEYVGHTATKTQKVIDERMGGVLFIDEIYALGNGGSKGESKTDSFSTECINTLNQNLTEHKGKFICIIAGYKHETEKHFFGLNPGLRRRFSFYYTINGYDWEELTKILMFKINKLRHWSAVDDLDETLLTNAFLQDKTEHFKHYAGDIETLLLNTKIAHCKRVFGKQEVFQRVITYQDVVDGYARFVAQKGADVERRKEELRMIEHLYS